MIGAEFYTMQSGLHTPPDQAEVIRFLQDGAGTRQPAQRIDTHGAMVFLIGDKAFKIKRAVKYDYMDLSTVAKRHALLVREFELNQPTAPSIYHGVQPVIRQSDGTFALGGEGVAVEWVLVMHRFAPKAELSHIARHSGISDDLAQDLGAAIARYHGLAPVSTLDGAALIREILEELDRVFGAMPKGAGPQGQITVGKAQAEWARHEPQLQERTQQGHIRRCHGDLHLRNIVMIDGVPTPCDALEFDERLGTCDTLYDLAFLLMDLDHLKMRHVANLTLNAYLHSAPDAMSQTGLALLPLYLAIRAMIRAMVDIQTAVVSDAGGDLIGDARAYLEQAFGYLDPATPMLVAFGGFSGTGKTTLARAVAHEIGKPLGALHIRSDILRKTLMHQDPLMPLPAAGYTPQVSAQTYAAMRQQAGEALCQGQSVVLDAVHGDPDTRLAAEEIARAKGVGFLGIWLESSTQTRLARVSSRGPDASDADAAVVKEQAAADPGDMGWHRIKTDQPLATVIGEITSLLRAGRRVSSEDSEAGHDR